MRTFFTGLCNGLCWTPDAHGWASAILPLSNVLFLVWLFVPTFRCNFQWPNTVYAHLRALVCRSVHMYRAQLNQLLNTPIFEPKLPVIIGLIILRFIEKKKTIIKKNVKLNCTFDVTFHLACCGKSLISNSSSYFLKTFSAPAASKLTSSSSFGW